jgi:hypothetical protein
MTLTEYLNQQEPKRNPNVILDKTEYTIGSSIKTGNKTLKMVFITDGSAELLWGIEYVLINDDKTLWTTDKDGNPKARSCFSIK